MRPVIIGVAGGSGSGKTTVVSEIVRRIGDEHVSRLQHDWYYLDRGALAPEERDRLNYDHPGALETTLLAEHLASLRRGEPVEAPVYDFATHTRTTTTRRVAPRPVIILDGILILADAALCELMDVRVFVQTDADIRFIRRLTRDVEERNRTVESVIQQYLESVQPMHLEFVEPSKRHAHVIIPEGGRNQVAVDMLVTNITSIVEAGGARI